MIEDASIIAIASCAIAALGEPKDHPTMLKLLKIILASSDRGSTFPRGQGRSNYTHLDKKDPSVYSYYAINSPLTGGIKSLSPDMDTVS